MTLLITGASGFIGTELIRDLLENNFQEEIIMYDQFEPKNELKEIKGYSDYVRYIQGNILEHEKIISSLDNVETVIHLAAIADVKKCQNEPEETRKINIGGTQVLLEAIKKSSAKRV